MGADCCGPKEPETKVPMWKYIALMGLMCGGGLQVVLPLIDKLPELWADMPPLFGEVGYVELRTDSPELGDVFFGGQPWLVLCGRSKVSKPAMWMRAAEYLQNLDEDGDAPFNMGVLDCDKKLPSGKTTYERFKLTIPANHRPHALLLYNGRTPSLITANLQSTSETAVEKFVKSIATKTMISMPAVRTSADLESKCLALRHCVVVAHNGLMIEYEKDWLMGLAKTHRTIRFVKVNLDLLALSLEASLPAPVDEHPRLVAMKRQGDTKTGQLTAKAYTGDFTKDAMSAFVGGAAAKGGGKGWQVLNRQEPALAKRTEYITNLYQREGATEVL